MSKKKNKLSDLEKEILKIRWKDIYINGRKSDYKISDNGFLMSYKQKKEGYLMSPSPDSSGYYGTTLVLDGKKYWRAIHILVAEAFVVNPDPINKIEVNHKDGKKNNNEWWNLEWVTHHENITHAVELGLRDTFLGINSPKNIYSEETIHQVCQLLEKGNSQKKIAEDLHINKGVVNSIKQKKMWKHISKAYDIPEPIHRIPRPSDLRSNVIDLLNLKKDPDEIIRMLELPDTRVNRTYVRVIRVETQPKVESSTTIPRAEMPTGVGPEANAGG